MAFPEKAADILMDPGTEYPVHIALAIQSDTIVETVREAIKHKQVLLAYQPIVGAQNTNKVAFYEGLIRVLDETGRVIPAGRFMPQIEESDIGRQIDTLALGLGLRALSLNEDLRLAINMSARSIGYQHWTDTLNQWLEQDQSIADRLILEITEDSAMLIPELVVDFTDRLQMHGICFAMDNFGSGMIAMRHFKQFGFDILKIDGQFIRNIANDPDNQAATAALMSIAHHFDMLAVAEQVETAEDAKTLAELGIDCMQGHYFAAASTEPPWATP